MNVKKNIEETQVEIRQAKYSELAFIAEHSEGSGWTPDALAKIVACAYELAPQYILVAVVDGELVGHFVCIPRVGRFWLKLLMKGELFNVWKGELGNLPLDYRLYYGAQVYTSYVCPQYRGMGIASLMSRKSRDNLRAAGIHKFGGWIRADNTACQTVAEKTGGMPTTKRRGWIRYVERTDAEKQR